MPQPPPAELRKLWLDAVLLPGTDDPRQSCLQELAEYTNTPEDEVLHRCESALQDQRSLWEQKDRTTAEGLLDFYSTCDAYVYELLWWHALQHNDTPAWNAKLVDLPCKSYLDYGGGIGTNAILLARHGVGDVTVADVSDVLLDFARWRLERRGLQATFIDLKTTELEPASYDLISAVDVLEHVPRPLETLRRITTALAPGGLLMFDLVASKPDPARPFHLMRSKYPVRSSIRGMGYAVIDRFQKFLVCRKVSRSPLENSLVSLWDRVRWRGYYLIQGRWPGACV